MCITILVVGDCAVGKSLFIRRLYNKLLFTHIYKPTYDIQWYSLTDKCIIIDTYGGITELPDTKIDGVIMIFDKTNVCSFNNIIKKWFPLVEKTYNDVPIILCGNKCMKSNVMNEKYNIEKFIDENDIVYYDTSTKSMINCVEPVENLIDFYS